MGRVALVTGANQGLGLALVRGLCAALSDGDTVYLTARNPALGRAAAEAVQPCRPELRVEPLDVTADLQVAGVADLLHRRHGGIDIVISSAAARIVRELPQERQVATFIDTNNHGTVRMLRHFLPLLRPQGRFLVVASSFGRLRNLPPQLHPLFDTERLDQPEIDAVMADYACAVQEGRAAARGWPDWINIPSKVGQVAAARIAARHIRTERPGDGILVNAVCPGLVDTPASRPWFEDMSAAQTPDQAAEALLWLALLPPGSTAPHGELVRFRRTLSWT